MKFQYMTVHFKVKTVVVDLPSEVCDLQPRTQCKYFLIFFK